MGGKTAQSTAQVSIPPEIMAQYNAVNAKAEQAGAAPFQPYSNNPDAFVAPLTGTQQAGMRNINNAQGIYQPFYNAATQSLAGGQQAADPLQARAAGNIEYGQGLGLAGTQSALQSGAAYMNPATALTAGSAQAVNPTGLGAAEIGKYMSPYLDTQARGVLGNLRQDQQQQQSAMQGDQIKAGAFGGDRGRIGQANLARQQNLAEGQILGDIYQGGYSQALGAAQQQQGVQLGAGQANRAALGQAGSQMAALGQQAYGQQSGAADQMYRQSLGAATAQQGLGQQVYGQGAQTSQQLSQLGSGAQAAALAGGQAQLGAGQIEQQTQQAGLQSQYNQFLQQQGYPFQVAQFLAGIAMGTGALSGSTTTNTQPTSFMGGLSDARMKENMEPVGETYDGQKIMKYNYKGEKRKQIGLIAQDVEKHNPDAVREKDGIKYVDYDRATKDAVHRARAQFADGGAVDPTTMAEILRMQKAMYPFMAEGAGRTGGGTGPRGMSLMSLPNAKLMSADAPKINDPGIKGLGDAAQNVSDAVDMGKDLFGGKPEIATGALPAPDIGDVQGAASALGKADISGIDKDELTREIEKDKPSLEARGGLVLDRGGFARGGIPYGEEDSGYVPVDEQFDDKEHKLDAPDAPDIKSGGGLGDLISTGKKIAGLFADGGSVDDEEERSNVVPRENTLLGWLDRSRQAAEDRNNAGPSDTEVGDSNREWAGNLWKKYITGGTLDGIKTPISDVKREPDVAAPTPVALGRAKAPTPPPLENRQIGPVAHKPNGLVMEGDAAPARALGDAATASRELHEDPATKPAPQSSRGDYAVPKGRGTWMQRNQDWLVPLLKGVGTTASSPSRYLGAALLQGAGAAAGAYGDTQDAMQKRELRGAQIETAKRNLLPTSLQGSALPYPDAKGDTRYEPITDRIDQPGAAGAATAAKPPASPIVAKFDPETKQFKFTVSPDATVDNLVAERGIKRGQNINNQATVKLKGMEGQDQAEKKQIDDRLSQRNTIETTHKDLILLAEQSSIPRDGITAVGAGHQVFAPLVNTINYMARMAGVPPPSDLNGSETADQLTNKIAQWSATMRAQQGGMPGHVQEALAAAFPGGHLTPEANEKMVLSLLGSNQRERDFIQYAPSYANDYGIALGTTDTFNSVMNPVYNKELSSLDGMMKQKTPTGESVFVRVLKNKANLTEDDKLKLAKAYGPGILRWLTVY